ncbi:MAG: DNA primase [Planctomycetota bacterium]
MSFDPEFRRAIEEIKLRAPIETIVGETCELKQKGRDMWACCPFHEERTPSFKVDVREGTWYCFGACRKGGDVIKFVQERGNMTFMDAMELLAAQTGVELPRRKARRTSENDPGLAALSFAAAYFQAELRREEGRDARRYLASRRFEENAIEAFGLGWSPRNGRRFLKAAEAEGIQAGALVDVGLARRRDGNGELYAFFRGRLMIPIRDQRGTTIGFGGRVVGDEDGPKYVNTSETRYFHKGQVIYALDRALEHVRARGHLVLVEGYTDVIAAHAAGLPNVAAVLGTATTEMHAALVRRAGTRRVSLVFDGDEAGRRAAWRGLEGLLPLTVKLEVVPMPEGVDPADVLMGEGGAAAFSARLETGLSWLDFVVECVEAVRGDGPRAFSQEVDRALELLLRLPSPVEVDAAATEMAGRLSLPLDTLREQLRMIRDRGRGRGRGPGAAGPGGAPPGGPGGPPGARGPGGGPGRGPGGGPGASSAPGASRGDGSQIPPTPPVDLRVVRAYEALLGAALADTGLVSRLRPHIQSCPDPTLATLFQVLVDLWDNEDSEITVSLFLNSVSDPSARDRVLPIREDARKADSAQNLFERAVAFLDQHHRKVEDTRLNSLIQALEPLAESDEVANGQLDTLFARLLELRKGASDPRNDPVPALLGQKGVHLGATTEHQAELLRLQALGRALHRLAPVDPVSARLLEQVTRRHQELSQNPPRA